MTSLEGRVIAVTGAGSGIGFATARLLASRGASISVADIRKKDLDSAIAELKRSNPKIKIYAEVVDVRKGQEVGEWLDRTVKYLGALNGAVNAAGVPGQGTTIAVTTDKDWDSVVDVNLKGVFNCIRAELNRMDKDASIVNTSSVGGLEGFPTAAAYSASKHAVIGLTRSAAGEVAKRNIRVNCVAP